MEELRKSYKSGITSLILIAVFFLLLASLVYINNHITILIINILSFITLILAIAFYFKMMVGYIYIGKKYSKPKKSTYGILTCLIIFLLLIIILYFASIEKSILIINTLALLLLITYICFAILKSSQESQSTKHQ